MPFLRASAATVASLAVLVSYAGEPHADEGVRLRGTFLQLWEGHCGWPVQQWSALLDSFAELGIEEIYLQWTWHDGRNFAEPAQGWQDAPLDILVRQARLRGLKIHLGLSARSDYYERVRPGPELAGYLAALRGVSLEQARRLLGLAARESNVIQGWYLPEEIEEGMWPEWEPRRLLVHHLRTLAEELKRMAPSLPVAVSAYAGIRTSPAGLSEFWRGILAGAPVDEVLFQDGVGAGNLPLAYVPEYFAAMERGLQGSAARLRIIVETFRQVDGPFNGRSFRAVPAPAQLILSQMETAAPWSAGGLVAFSVPEYLSPFGGPDAGANMRKFLALMRDRNALADSGPLAGN